MSPSVHVVVFLDLLIFSHDLIKQIELPPLREIVDVFLIAIFLSTLKRLVINFDLNLQLGKILLLIKTM